MANYTEPPLPEIDGVEARRIKDCPGYAATSDGRILSCKNNRHGYRWWSEIKPWCSAKDGRLRIGFNLGGKRKAALIHVVIAETFIGPRPAGMECCHNDGNCRNNRADNLRWDTPEGNYKDRYKHGDVALGERHGWSVLNEERVMAIRKEYIPRSRYASLGVLAKKHGVGAKTVHDIVKRKTWAHLT